MTGEIRFYQRITTRGRARLWFPASIESVGKALDDVHELPKERLETAHWHAAAEALSASVNDPESYDKMLIAHDRLCQALEAEGWLDNLPTR